MNGDTWYLLFAAISGIGAICMVSGKSLGKAEKVGLWIIFGGFASQTIWYVWKSNWSGLELVLLVGFILLAVMIYFIIRPYYKNK